jgi:hypothetical protein
MYVHRFIVYMRYNTDANVANGLWFKRLNENIRILQQFEINE